MKDSSEGIVVCYNKSCVISVPSEIKGMGYARYVTQDPVFFDERADSDAAV